MIGNGVEVWRGSVAVLAGVIVAAWVGIDVPVEEGVNSWGVDIRLAAGAHPDRKITATGKRRHRRFMVYKLDVEWKCEWA